ncbi:hypothetical protein KFL_007840010 [Klebsormidium nitens]|uniref:SMP-30/Gluconolactonase/LRE-like region domain-containing protein n=1 Tax=Klebsormidium nitens TaxID=105231 RepID=A0A1Y1IQB0_KLENI|nr:hypothetical protein KFL_007840010 [Klebsormidium nitens]|eukprot:GAQ91431.1 hypothetical protein KFL_007840010 [Klebsormidium nitens]
MAMIWVHSLDEVTAVGARSLLQGPAPAPVAPTGAAASPTNLTPMAAQGPAGSVNATALLNLPQVCLFQQGFVYNKTGSGASKLGTCVFEVWDLEFLEILPTNPVITELATAPAHEAGVYSPSDNSVFVTSTLNKTTGNSMLMKVDLSTGAVTYVLNQTAGANGAILASDGALILCMQGSTAIPGHLLRLNLSTGQQTVIADNWFGLEFNSPNDVVEGPDGSFYFTDPSYGYEQGFKNPPQTFQSVYRVLPSGRVDAVAEGLLKPNGIAFSPDYAQLAVTDTGYASGFGTNNVTRPHSVYVYDVTPGGRLTNKQFFVSTASYDAPYRPVIPDGIKVDSANRVYLGTADGVQVFDRDGSPLGLIRYPNVANFALAGPALNTLVLFNDTNIATVQLASSVVSAGQPYAKRVLNIRP